ncbi:TPR repeat-containing thioredoxin TDX-like [Salvia splendens]|nr:TPR repeat-containing thioredoxin TDX-like [Salvia splendens]
MLGLWEEAARDFHVASTLDFDAFKQVSEDASVSKDGEVPPIHSGSELEEKLRTRNFFFMKVEIDEAREVVAEWNISSITTFFFVRNGEEVDQLVTVDKDMLEQKIAQHA